MIWVRKMGNLKEKENIILFASKSKCLATNAEQSNFLQK
jgi:hypothetical protein